MTNWGKLNDTSLPPRESYYSSLTESVVSEEDYRHIVDVWNEFGIINLREYSELYLLTDVPQSRVIWREK